MSFSSLREDQPLHKKRSERESHRQPGQVKSRTFTHSRRIWSQWLRMSAVAAVFGGLYVWYGGASLLFLLMAVLVLMFGGLLLQVLGPRRIKLVRTITPLCPAAGDAVQVQVRVSFSARLPLPWMIVTDYWKDGSHQELLFPGFRRSFTYTYTLEGVRRGVCQLQGCSVRWGDLPGWFTGSSQPEGRDSFRVLPSPLYFGRFAPEGGWLPGETRFSGRGRSSGDETLEVRDYAPGDPLSRIHWKNSARRGTLQSRVPEREKGCMTCVVLANDPQSYLAPPGALAPRARRGENPAAFERAVSTAMGLLLAAENSGSYVQLYSGGWPEGMARHEGLGQIPARVLHMLTEIAADGSRSLAGLLEDASRSWLPGMKVAVITGQLEEESAQIMARFLVQGVKVELYYAWDHPAPAPAHTGAAQAPLPKTAGSIGDSLVRLGARLYCLEDAKAYGHREVEYHESPGKPTLR
ncbi:DUF58 domain-containing protein [Paenibacillus albidus]|uniref:DUF58 domain-containing protein n=1 Tax=Paenibacillus albidus TaxID=2041023 RepID=UPI001BE7B2D5|nr:DUF58 domain-containing protein [Paenibacillus albidus]MBT2293415.1 DUF58 domain-containing protein [Paenibacillus albidus]